MIAVIFEVEPADDRKGVFDDYRLRIANVVRDYGLYDRAQAPSDSKQAHAKLPEP